GGGRNGGSRRGRGGRWGVGGNNPRRYRRRAAFGRGVVPSEGVSRPLFAAAAFRFIVAEQPFLTETKFHVHGIAIGNRPCPNLSTGHFRGVRNTACVGGLPTVRVGKLFVNSISSLVNSRRA